MSAAPAIHSRARKFIPEQSENLQTPCWRGDPELCRAQPTMTAPSGLCDPTPMLDRPGVIGRAKGYDAEFRREEATGDGWRESPLKNTEDPKWGLKFCLIF